MQKKIDDLTLQTKEQETQISKLNTLYDQKEKEIKKVKKRKKKQEFDLTGEQIQKIMEENAKLRDDLDNLNKRYNCLESYCKNLAVDNFQIQSYCGQIQLLLLMKMQQNPFNNNVNNFNSFQNNSKNYTNQINGFIEMSNNKNKNNNFFNMNNKMNKNQNLITITFNLENKTNFPIVTLPEYRLGNIMLLVLNRMNLDFSFTNRIKFYYDAKNITKHFLNNDEVRSLNFKTYTPVILVTQSDF